MSIEKDVERMYKEDKEKNMKNQKKKKKKHIFSTIIIIIIIVALLLLMKYLGLGFGGGKGSGEKDASSSVSSTVKDESSEIKKEYVDIKASGTTYLYKGKEISLEDLRTLVKGFSENTVINILDDNATKNTVEALEKMVKEEGKTSVKQVITNADSSSTSDSDDSQSSEE